jgi:hypothetical protein
VWKHGVHALGWQPNLEKWRYHGPTQQLHFPMQPDWRTLPPVTWINHYIFYCFRGVMGGAEAWARSMSSLTQEVCTPAIHLISWTWCQCCQHGTAPCTTDTPSTRNAHISIDCLGMVGQGNGLQIRHLLQLPVKLTLSARHLQCLCCRFLPKQLALLYAIENASSFKLFNGQFSVFRELSYWNGTVLNAAHGMIAASTEIMHVLLLRPDRASLQTDRR